MPKRNYGAEYFEVRRKLDAIFDRMRPEFQRLRVATLPSDIDHDAKVWQEIQGLTDQLEQIVADAREGK